MFEKVILIDTNIWHFAYKMPKEEKYIQIHKLANKFLKDIFSQHATQIGISSYQIAEIMDVLRKAGLNRDIRKEILKDFDNTKFKIVEIQSGQVKIYLDKSIVSKIHIYDYLVAFPLKGLVTEIYSADDHFQHEDFKAIAEVINPLSPWVLREGRKPIIQNENN